MSSHKQRFHLSIITFLFLFVSMQITNGSSYWILYPHPNMWMGDLPSFYNFNPLNNSYIEQSQTSINITWSFFNETSVGIGEVTNFTIYYILNNGTIILLEEYNQNTLGLSIYEPMTIQMLPNWIIFNFEDNNIVYGMSITLFFHIDLVAYINANNIHWDNTVPLVLNYMDIPPVPIIDQLWYLPYLLVSGIGLGVLIGVYIWYSRKNANKDQIIYVRS